MHAKYTHAMATYQLEIRIDTGYLKRFAERGMKLCFSTSVSTGRDRTFKNVVACAKSMEFGFSTVDFANI